MKYPALFVLLSIWFNVLSQPTEPMLMVNSAMHTAMIRKISTDAAGKLALTVSDDKTARLWNVEDGSLIKVLRVPSNNGDDGKLFAGALSADGRIAAVGGWTAWDWEQKASIYLFDTRSGQMINRLSGLPQVINDLEFSSDGRFLAAGLGGANGVRIFSIQSWTLQHNLEGYGSGRYNVAFSPSGSLATVCFDGKIRLYNADFMLQKEVETTAGKEPYSLDFSKDGKSLAVGYNDSPVLEIRDGQSLRILSQPEVTDIPKGKNIGIVSFNGNQLLAGGSYQKVSEGKWKNVLRLYQQNGRGSHIDIPVAGNTILDIKALPDGGWLFAGSQPYWGRISASGEIRYFKEAEVLDLRATDLSHLRINRTGSEIGFTPLGQDNISFRLAQRSLLAEQSLQPAYTERAGSMAFSNWQNSNSPELNGQKLDFLKQYEMCRSVDVDGNGETGVMGTGWNLYGINAQGQKIWKTPMQGTAWCVNISGNDKVVLAGLGDGTLRWYRMSDGQLLLSFYLHPDKERWVLWTPSGYYDAAPGSEGLICWRLNQGPDKEALFYQASQFRGQFYRPDVIDQILETYDEAEALKKANDFRGGGSINPKSIVEIQPPVAVIINPASGTKVNSLTQRISYRITTPSDAPVLEVWATVNGTRGLKPVQSSPGNEGSLEVQIPADNCTVTLYAKNKNGTSEGSSIRLEWAGQKPTQTALIKPNLYVLAIGVSKYQNPEYNLDYPHQDAMDVAGSLKRQEGKIFSTVTTHVLPNEQANTANIRKELSWLKKNTTQHDLAILFFAGHGMKDNTNDFYFCTHETDVEDLSATGLPQAFVLNEFDKISGKAILFMDACHSGSLGKKTRSLVDINKVINDFTQAEGKITFSSSTGKQLSQEDPSWQNGAFTEAFLSGMAGGADYDKNGIIYLKELDLFITNEVKRLTKGEQSPTTHIPPDVPDFPIAVKP